MDVEDEVGEEAHRLSLLSALGGTGNAIHGEGQKRYRFGEEDDVL